MDDLRPHVGFAGDGTPMGTRLQKAKARARRFGGYDVVPAAAAVAIVEQVLDPGSLGLVKVRERTWVGPGGEGRFRTLTLVPMKGLAYRLVWGVSLSYVPHGWTPKPQFHRTAKSARPDLSHSSTSGFDESELGGAAGWIDRSLGRDCVLQDAQTVWARSRPSALSFWERTTDDRGVLDLVLERRPDGARDSVAIVGALAAARLGLCGEAEDLLADAELADATTRDSALSLVRTYLESAATGP